MNLALYLVRISKQHQSPLTPALVDRLKALAALIPAAAAGVSSTAHALQIQGAAELRPIYDQSTDEHAGPCSSAVTLVNFGAPGGAPQVRMRTVIMTLL